MDNNEQLGLAKKAVSENDLDLFKKVMESRDNTKYITHALSVVRHASSIIIFHFLETIKNRI